MPRRRDEESGRYTDDFSDDAFLAVIQKEEIAGTTEIAESVGCTRRQALNRLKEMESEGLIESKDVGRALVWRVTE